MVLLRRCQRVHHGETLVIRRLIAGALGALLFMLLIALGLVNALASRGGKKVDELIDACEDWGDDE